MKASKGFVSCCTAAAVVTLLSVSASGKVSDMKNIPNGKKFSCAPCHGEGSKKNLTSFGKDYLANGRIWNAALAKKDSNLNGRTNGQELGDPEGTWKKGDADPSGQLTNPGESAK